MGQEISRSHFSEADFAAFGERLRAETALLDQWFREGRFAATEAKGGFELEAWLVDRNARPAGINQPYLQRLDSPLVVPELATFNVEINGSPQPLHGRALSHMAEELSATWKECNQVAGGFDARLGMIGILPTVAPADLCLANMSPLQRYRALNDQVLRLRQGRPLEVDIQGREHLRMQHQDVMLESAATSFQIHLKVSAEHGARYYNASKILSAPMVALAANSLLLFGRSLWEETRV
ncbi:MAG TPA: glutamate--cysteine ligase, partial [Kiloniellaceae bacterium]|nr:glutamate--cysteine ligase [Kiloniellaceae bacterium]